MPTTPCADLRSGLPPEARARTDARNTLLSELLERSAAEHRPPDASPLPAMECTRRRVRQRTAAKRKRVQCFGHGVLNAGPHYRAAWQDVWLRWKGSDRKVYRAAPCLLSCNEAVFDWLSVEADLQCETAPEERTRLGKEVAEARATMAWLETNQYHIADGPFPDVRTWVTSINRAEAERMLSHLLDVRFGVKNPKFVWRRIGRDAAPVLAHSFGPFADGSR